MSTVTLPRALRDALKAAPDSLVDRIDAWLMEQHDPVIGSFPVMCSNRNLIDHRGPVEWPCKDWTEAAERRAARRA